MSRTDSVSITVVTYNSGRFIKRCLEAALAEPYSRKQVVVVDNGSTDGTVDILEQFEDRCLIVYNQHNTGFAAAQNQAIALTASDWVLTLNPDVLLMPRFLEALVEAGNTGPGIGSVCPKLLSIQPDFHLPEKPLLDSTGIYFTPMLRHLDRDSQQVDRGAADVREYVFGGTGAATLYRRTMIDDIAIDGEFFDSDFFIYREDADVAWRAQLLGWKCLYNPEAHAYHVRTVVPGNRRALPAIINLHSVKNRFFMRLKNMTGDLYRRNWATITARDVVVVSCCLLREHTSLPAFWQVARQWNRMLAKRRSIMRKRRVDDDYMARWFSFRPVSQPAPLPEGSRSTSTAGAGRR